MLLYFEFRSKVNYCFLQWVKCDTLSGHNGSIIAVDAITFTGSTAEQETLVLTASADSTVKIWKRESAEGTIIIIINYYKLLLIPDCLMTSVLN